VSSIIIYFMTGLQNDAGKFFIFFADLLLSLVSAAPDTAVVSKFATSACPHARHCWSSGESQWTL
jgi:hypothetical protein